MGGGVAVRCLDIEHLTGLHKGLAQSPTLQKKKKNQVERNWDVFLPLQFLFGQVGLTCDIFWAWNILFGSQNYEFSLLE
jgi:hypothetical protein